MTFRARVLLADDHPGVLDHVSRILAEDYEVIARVTNGRAAVDAAFELHPDLVVLDIMMPELDGFHAARELRDRGSSAKVIFLTIQQDEEYVSTAMESGGAAYVLKSRMYSDLVRALGQVLAGNVFVSESLV